MDDCVQRWKHHGNGKTWSRIAAHKDLVVEPRSAADLKARDYDDVVDTIPSLAPTPICGRRIDDGFSSTGGVFYRYCMVRRRCIAGAELFRLFVLVGPWMVSHWGLL